MQETVLSTLQSLWFSPLPKKQDDKANAGSSGSKVRRNYDLGGQQAKQQANNLPL